MKLQRRARMFQAILGILVVGGLLSPFIYLHLREIKLKHLYYEATGIPPYFSNTADSVRAVHEIGSIGGEESRRLLMSIASTDSYLPTTRIQVAAIQELSRTHQADAAEMIASLVTIDNPLDLRKASAKALQTLPCKDACLTELLSYLRMIDDGRLNEEDRGQQPSHNAIDREVKIRIRAEQRDIYELLYRRLLLDPASTNGILEKTYGLGGANPQPFSIRFAVESKDHDACTLLNRSKHALAGSPSADKSICDEVDDALKDLSCEK